MNDNQNPASLPRNTPFSSSSFNTKLNITLSIQGGVQAERGGSTRRSGVVLKTLLCILAVFSFLHFSKLSHLHHTTTYDNVDSGYDNVGHNNVGTTQLEQSNDQSNIASSLSSSSIATTFKRINNKARVLMGIFTSDTIGQSRHRKAFRSVLKIHPKVCSLHDYIYHPTALLQEQCELIYSFVIGDSNDPNGQTEIVSYQENHPVIVNNKRRTKSFFSNDLHESDITFLNIKENKNEGKSQTWFYYASLAMEKYGIEYAMKLDSDSLIYLDRYFTFADHSLPPAPYNNRIIAGIASNKAWWDRSFRDGKTRETFFYQQYSSMHLYAEGKMYILSKDLVNGVVDVAATNWEARRYKEGVEDHDISLFAFLAAKLQKDNPIKFVIIPNKNTWWRHDINIQQGVSVWQKAWDEEIIRMNDKYAPAGDDKEQNNIILVERVFPAEAHKDQLENTILATQSISLPPPKITSSMRKMWRDHLGNSNMEKLANDIHKLDLVQINNTIAPTNSCFTATGYLEKPVRIIEFTAEGGKHWSEFANIIGEKSVDPDIIILNQMDISMDRSGNIHTVEMLAVELGMNYAWGMEFVDLNNDLPGEALKGEYGGFSGHAVLSKCHLYDPLIVRDPPDNEYIMESKQYGSRIGLFVRTGFEKGSHLVVGSAHKIDPALHREQIWKYQFGDGPDGLLVGTQPANQIGTILAGEIDRSLCTQSGLANLDKMDSVTFPVDCSISSHGTFRADNFCGNLMRSMDHTNSYYLPCIRRNLGSAEETQISKHAIISILLQ